MTIGQDGIGSAEDAAQRLQKSQDHGGQHSADACSGDDGGADRFGRLLRLAFSKLQAEIGGQTVPEQRGQGDGKGGDWGDDVGGSVAQHTDALADEHLVHHVVKGVDDHGDDAGNGKISQ